MDAEPGTRGARNQPGPLPWFPSALGVIPMSFQDETKARRILDLWRGASEAHIRPARRDNERATTPEVKKTSELVSS